MEDLHAEVELALDALDADGLRQALCELLVEMDERAFHRAATAILNQAARGGSGWRPPVLEEREVSEAVAFAAAARRTGYADPDEVDDHLQSATAAFLGRDYAAAQRIYQALLPPLADGAIHLGEDEMLQEVLGIEPADCAGHYLVCAYLLAEPEHRARAVRTAMDEVWGLGGLAGPVQTLVNLAVEPLPGLDDFLPRWRALVAQEAAGDPGPWDGEAAGWLREVTRRLEGAAGLAELARSTRRPADLRAWCDHLVAERDWPAALAAFDEAAGLADGEAWLRGTLLDGAALCAQERGTEDASLWLERAWHAAPSLPRLLRWLGSPPADTMIHRRVAAALAACPARDHRQRGLLHVLQGEFDAAAGLLADAPGLGWSSAEHPGHLLFAVFQFLLGGSAAPPPTPRDTYSDAIEELGRLSGHPREPRLATPELAGILRQPGVDPGLCREHRATLLAALRTAAEKRVAGVTGQKRRRHYGHAAALVAACVACDATPATVGWAAGLRDAYRRFPALRAEFDQHLGRS